MPEEPQAQLKFVCLRQGNMLRLHMYTEGGTLMSSLQSADPHDLKAFALTWLATRGLPFDQDDLEAAIRRAQADEP